MSFGLPVNSTGKIIYWSYSCVVSHFNHVQLLVTIWTVYSLPGSSVHGILQSRILEWVAVPFSRGSSWPRAQTLGLLHCRQILYHLSHQGCNPGGSCFRFSTQESEFCIPGVYRNTGCVAFVVYYKGHSSNMPAFPEIWFKFTVFPQI